MNKLVDDDVRSNLEAVIGRQATLTNNSSNNNDQRQFISRIKSHPNNPTSKNFGLLN